MNDSVIATIEPPYPFEAYTHIIEPLSESDGGGFLITFPDLAGCMADGETEAEAIENGRDAFLCWVSAVSDMGETIPAPLFKTQVTREKRYSGRFVQRVPKSIHAQLTDQAKHEGVSLNSLVLAFIAEGLGRNVEAR